MEILQLVDQLEQVLNQGWRVPFTSSLMVNEEECLRLIDQMRISVPSAIKESERMIAERDRILHDARLRGEAIVTRAEEEAMKRVGDHYVVQEARREAERIVNMGQDEGMRMIQESEEYALDVLRQLATQLGASLRQAENGIHAIEESRDEPDMPEAKAAVTPKAAPPVTPDNDAHEDEVVEVTDEDIKA